MLLKNEVALKNFLLLFHVWPQPQLLFVIPKLHKMWWDLFHWWLFSCMP